MKAIVVLLGFVIGLLVPDPVADYFAKLYEQTQPHEGE